MHNIYNNSVLIIEISSKIKCYYSVSTLKPSWKYSLLKNDVPLQLQSHSVFKELYKGSGKPVSYVSLRV